MFPWHTGTGLRTHVQKDFEKNLLTYASNFESDIFKLETTDDARVYQIHSNLLTTKGGVLKTVAQVDGGFKESKDRAYTFKSTSTGTVARFVEWAYKGDYSANLPVEHSAEEISRLRDIAEADPAGSEIENLAKRIRDTTVDENHILLCHARVYIFGDAYLIPGLKTLAFDKLTKGVQRADKYNSLDRDTAIIKLLDYCFSNLHPDDELLDFLGQYTAFRIHKLREIPNFLDIVPKVGYAILPYIGRCTEPPWEKRHYETNSKLPHYTGR
ncbi:MAG: hypothetical protein Q9160_002651 [Pyrenula sp. 1 TL-2023]